jgi:hypothetical protein
MTTYKVLSDNFVLGKQGETIDTALLDGYNIESLVAGQHIVEVNAKISKSVTSETEK